jgi:hypothetical protein
MPISLLAEAIALNKVTQTDEGIAKAQTLALLSIAEALVEINKTLEAILENM